MNRWEEQGNQRDFTLATVIRDGSKELKQSSMSRVIDTTGQDGASVGTLCLAAREWPIL